MKHVISVLVEDQFGALARVVELFTSRGYNLDSLCTGEAEHHGVHRMTIVTGGDDAKIRQILRLLDNIVYVLDVRLLSPSESFNQELLLMKVGFEPGQRGEVLSLINAYEGRLIELNGKAVSFQVLGTSSKLDGIKEVFSDYHIIEMARTGEAAIHK